MNSNIWGSHKTGWKLAGTSEETTGQAKAGLVKMRIFMALQSLGFYMEPVPLWRPVLQWEQVRNNLQATEMVSRTNAGSTTGRQSD